MTDGIMRMKEGDGMKRRYSISLGLGSVGCVAYLALLGWYVYTLFQGGDTGYPVTIEDLPFHLIIHICLAVIASLFTWIAFFTNIFTIAVSACVCFIIGGIIFYHYLLFCTPLIVFTVIGSVFCYKQQKLKTEKKEEKVIQKKGPAEKKPHAVHEKREQVQRNTRQQMLTRRMQQNQQSNLQGNTQMLTPNYIQPIAQPLYAPMHDPYAPLTQGALMQPTQVANAVYPYPMYGGEQLAAQPLQATYQPLPVNQNPAFPQAMPTVVPHPYAQPNQPLFPYQAPGMVNVQNQAGTVPQPHAGHTRGEGYFDDYGNFHPGGEQ